MLQWCPVFKSNAESKFASCTSNDLTPHTTSQQHHTSQQAHNHNVIHIIILPPALRRLPAILAPSSTRQVPHTPGPPLIIQQLSVVSIGNSIQAYASLYGTQQVYNGPAQKIPSGIPASTIAKQSTSPVTPLQARTFGTWTALSSIIRLYAAYNIHDPLVYQLAIWTYVIAFGHFISEWLVFGSASWGRGIAGPVFVASISLTWMLSQWGGYVQ